MFWAILWVLVTIASFAAWGFLNVAVTALAAGIIEAGAEGIGCLIILMMYVVVNALWILWLAFAVTKALAGLGVDVTLF